LRILPAADLDGEEGEVELEVTVRVESDDPAAILRRYPSSRIATARRTCTSGSPPDVEVGSLFLLACSGCPVIPRLFLYVTLTAG
jgi:hypothetical protein